MANIQCPYRACGRTFDNNNPESLVTRLMAASFLCGMGAAAGAEIGIAGGPMGAIAGTVPGGTVGFLVGWFLADQFRRCPHCGGIFKT